MIAVVVLSCTDAQYFYTTPEVPFPITTPSDEYLPPVTTRAPTTTTTRPTTTTPEPEPYDPDYNPDSNIPDISLLRTTTTARPTSPRAVTTTEHEEHHHHDVPFWDFRESIPGEPEVDYPILDKVPETKFACADRLDGDFLFPIFRQSPLF